MARIWRFAPLPGIFLLCSVPFAIAQQEPLGDVARRLIAEKKQAERREASIDVYEGHLTMKATPGFADANKQLVDRMGIVVRNSSARAYRYTFVAKCGEWNQKVSGNIEGSSIGYKEKAILLDLPSLCNWNEVSLEQVREAEGLEGPEPQPSKMPGTDDAELARQAKMQKVVENAPGDSISDLQMRVDEACMRQSLANVAAAPPSGIGDHMTACVKAQDDLAAALRVQGETQANAKGEPMNRTAPSGIVVRLTGTAGLPFTGTCGFSNRAGLTSKSYEDVLPFQVTAENVDNVNCSFISKSDFRHEMKLEILKDGRVIGESDTDAPYGLVSVSRDIN